MQQLNLWQLVPTYFDCAEREDACFDTFGAKVLLIDAKVIAIPIAVLEKCRRYSIALTCDTDINKPGWCLCMCVLVICCISVIMFQMQEYFRFSEKKNCHK